MTARMPMRWCGPPDGSACCGHNMRPEASQVGVVTASPGRLALQLVALSVCLTGCESPARVKPWRHAPDPTAEAARAPGSKILSEDTGEAAVFAARPHTLRIHMDADPGRLTPVVEPSLWATRITV